MFDYLQTCKQCLGQVAYFTTVHCVNTHRAQDNYEYSYEMTAATNLDIPDN